MPGVMQILLNVVLIFIGWIVVHNLTIKREKDKEKRQLAEKLIGMVEDLEGIARKYHMADTRQEAYEDLILSQIDKIERYLKRIHLFRNMQERMFIIKLRGAIALDNFGDNGFVTQNRESKILCDIANECSDMIEHIDASIIKIS